jgi:hypothetical protein
MTAMFLVVNGEWVSVRPGDLPELPAVIYPQR